MLLGLVIYFLLAVGLLALVCMPPLRDRAAASAHGVWCRGLRMGATWRATGALQAVRRGEAIQNGWRALRESGRRHGRRLVAAAGVIVLLPLGAVVLRGLYRVDSFDPNASRAVDQQVAELLQGEELVAPPSLPPEFFMTTEVEAWQPLARSASRQWDLLDEAFRQRLLMSFKILRDQYGYDMVLLEGYRSPQRQAALAALGTSVTRAGPFESYHQFGLAADCAFLRDGRIVISEKDPWAMAGYERYGQVARSLSLVWGGDWQRLRDLGHVELHLPRRAPGVRSEGAAPVPR